MAGYDRQIVVDAVQVELDRTTDGEDRKFDQALEQWRVRDRGRVQAEREAREAVALIVTAADAGDWKQVSDLAGQLTNTDRWTRGELAMKARSVEAPFRVRSARERSLQRVVDVIASADAATVTVADLRAWGVFDFVKHMNDAC